MNPYLTAIKTAFTHEMRPEHFTNFTHCCECAEHDEILRTHTRESIGRNELGNAGWDPICFITLKGFMYYFPALAELALGREEAFYLDQFVFHLNTERIGQFNKEQRRVVRDFIQYLQEELAEELSIGYSQFELKRLVIELEV